MKYRVLTGVALFISLIIFHNQAELVKEQLTQPPNEEVSSFIPHTNVIKTDETLEANIASVNKISSKAQSEASEKLENKQEQLVLPEMGIEQSIEFVDPNSELHETLLKEIKKNMSEKVLLKIRPGEKGIDLDGIPFSTYTSDRGIEFYKENIKWYEQFEDTDNDFYKIQDMQQKELENLGDWNSENESVIYQLVEKFNYEVVVKHHLAKISPINVDCRGHICSAHFSHSNDFFKGEGENVGELKSILAFMVFFKKQRSWCKCRGFEHFSSGWNESSFRFVFD